MSVDALPVDAAKFRLAWRSFVAIGGVRRIAEYIVADLQKNGQYEFGISEPGGRHGLPPISYFDHNERRRIVLEVDLRAAAKYALYKSGFYAAPHITSYQVAEKLGIDYCLAGLLEVPIVSPHPQPLLRQPSTGTSQCGPEA